MNWFLVALVVGLLVLAICALMAPVALLSLFWPIAVAFALVALVVSAPFLLARRVARKRGWIGS